MLTDITHIVRMLASKMKRARFKPLHLDVRTNTIDTTSPDLLSHRVGAVNSVCRFAQFSPHLHNFY